MIKVVSLLLRLPLPALTILIIALVFPAFMLLVLIAFVPDMTEKLIVLISALREKQPRKDKEK